VRSARACACCLEHQLRLVRAASGPGGGGRQRALLRRFFAGCGAFRMFLVLASAHQQRRLKHVEGALRCVIIDERRRVLIVTSSRRMTR
jgi:hypothetical protein